jgi:hypothetical protein
MTLPSFSSRDKRIFRRAFYTGTISQASGSGDVTTHPAVPDIIVQPALDVMNTDFEQWPTCIQRTLPTTSLCQTRQPAGRQQLT